MIHINEWDNPDWITLEWDAIPPAPGSRPRPPPDRAGRRPDPLVRAISAALEQLENGPAAVHFHGGEGLRWIRVGFTREAPLAPQEVQRIGRAIAACVGQEGPLFLHALRPRDLVFFLPAGQADRRGREPESFGAPLGDVLAAWGLDE